MQWKSYAVSHPGNKRNSNQDAYFCDDQHGMWAIADGMGGHEAGEIASQTIIQALANLAQSGLENSNILNINSMLEDVNQQLFLQNQHNQRVVGSTIAVVQITDEHCICLWVGDSRIYLYRASTLHQLSTDHSYLQQLINQGKLSSSAAENYQHKNILTRAIGVSAQLQLDHKEIKLQPKDKILLCSDGLYNELATQEISAILEYADLAGAAKNLLNLCLARAASDNISFIIVEID